MFDIIAFRTVYPEFSNAVKYPDDIIIYWSGYAEKYISEPILAQAYYYAWDLLTAHFLVFYAESQSQASSGNAPGGNSGAISSKQVGSATVSFDAQLSSETGAGVFNQTSYGRMYINLIKLCAPHVYQL